jgi:class 3 adenylate cyclase
MRLRVERTASSEDTRSDLAALVPPFVRAWVADDPRALNRTVYGTVLIASARDRSPVPLLNDAVMTACARGGTILKFSGDGILLLFTGEGEARRAEATAADLAARFGTTSGIDSGRLDLFLVGSSHRELFVGGPAVSGALERESSGPATSSPNTAAPLTSDVPTWPAKVHPGTFIPETLRRSASPATRSREMAVASMHLANLEELIEDVGVDVAMRHLCDLVSRVQRSFVEHDIAFLSSDVAVGGPTICCGALGSDDSMLRTLQEITDYPSPIELHVAVAHGNVTTGCIGSEGSLTFVAMGHAVTQARELMSYAAGNEILATASVVGRCALPVPHDRMTHIGSELVYRIAKPTHHRRGVVNMLLNLGKLAFEHDDHAGARHYFEEALTLSRHLGHQADEALLLMHLGHVALAMGDAELAMVRCDESLVLRRDLDDDMGVAETLALLGRARYADGDTASARMCWLRALETLRVAMASEAAPPSA